MVWCGEPRPAIGRLGTVAGNCGLQPASRVPLPETADDNPLAGVALAGKLWTAIHRLGGRCGTADGTQSTGGPTGNRGTRQTGSTEGAAAGCDLRAGTRGAAEEATVIITNPSGRPGGRT